MKFLIDNWWYFLIAAVMGHMMFGKGGCCVGHAHDESDHSMNSKRHSNRGSCCGSDDDMDLKSHSELEKSDDNLIIK